jgi:hypothetical protein
MATAGRTFSLSIYRAFEVAAQKARKEEALSAKESTRLDWWEVD